MPETDFYLCEKDVLEIAELVFNQGASIIPSLDYPTPELLKISEVDEVKRILHDSDISLLFVISPRWEQSSLGVQSITKEGRKVFFISQREGGPTIDIFFVRPLMVDGSRAVPPGFIAYHDSYWNPISKRKEPAPQPLIETYRVIRSHLAAGGRQLIRTHRRLIVTKNTLASNLKLLDLKKHAQEKPRFVEFSELE